MSAKDAICFDSNPFVGRSGMALDSDRVSRACQERAARMHRRGHVPHVRAVDESIGDSACIPMAVGIPGLTRLRRK